MNRSLFKYKNNNVFLEGLLFMEFIKTPVKGMRDYLPQDILLQQNVIKMIRETYTTYGFTEIETPAIEHIENLTNKQGGENEKLIFKILKRGKSLEDALNKGNYDFSDSGLRYDLTVPLARYYANNAPSLPLPFKALQIGSVWRADKPQKGRFRQFTQCDIDIIGENSIMAEIELIAATADMLTKIFAQIGISKFTVHVSDRHILKAMAGYAGFKEDDYSNIFIILDKYDKIGLEGIENELRKNRYDESAIKKYVDIFKTPVGDSTCNEYCRFLINEHLEGKYSNDLDTIIRCVRQMVSNDVNVIFDPTLVRGMAYYTGTIFECSIDEYNFAIAGGGRYDKMVGKYSGIDVSACGFSIGFERIITILNDHLDKNTYNDQSKYAFLIQQGTSDEKILEVFKQAQYLRTEGKIVTVQGMRKNLNRQIDDLSASGYSNISRIYKE